MKKHLLLFLLATPVFINVSAQNWVNGGNTLAANGTLGTNSSHSLIFETAGADRGRITNTGLWGIGGNVTDARLTVTGAAGARAFRVRVGSDTKFVVQGNGGVSIGSLTPGPANGLYVVGRVGIGTTSPSTTFHVVGSGLMTAGLTVSDGGISGTTTAANGNGVFGSGYYGVYGQGTNTGVFGKNTASSGFGVAGTGFIGVYATSSAISGDGVRTNAYNTNCFGVNAYSQLSFGVYGSTANAASYAGYFNGNVFTTGSYLPSDQDLKQDIEDMSSAMDILEKLQPKSYRYKQEGDYKLMNLPTGKRYGLIAQELEEVLPGLVKASEFNTAKAQGKEATNGETISFKAINYTELIPIVVKGMQEQQQQFEQDNKELKQQLEQQQQQIEELRLLVSKLANAQNISTSVNSASLLQNSPNPVRGTTRIPYSLPDGVNKAQLQISDALGRVIKTIQLTDSGVVNFDASSLSSGVYNYSLIVDGKTAATRKMTIQR